MVAAGVLGIGLLGLVKLHTTSIRGTMQAEDLGRAAEVARQLADFITAVEVDPTNIAGSLPNCAPGTATPLAAEPNGCRNSLGIGSQFAANRPAPCMQWFDGAGVPNASNGTMPVTAVDTGGYRVDQSLSRHPDNLRFPDAIVHTVWVCWRDGGGQVHEVETSRMIVPGI